MARAELPRHKVATTPRPAPTIPAPAAPLPPPAPSNEALALGQVPDQTLAAGELLILNCPAGSHPAVREGQSYPDASPSPDYKIYSINGESVVIGFLKGGSFRVEIPCTDEKKISSTVLLKTLGPQELPEAVPPLGMASLSYPLWFWLALALVGLGPLLFYFYRRSRLRRRVQQKTARARPLTPAEKLEHYLRDFSAQVKKQRDFSPRDSQALYSQGYSALRDFLDQRFKINAAHETTREFIGSLRATATLWNLAAADVATIDALLTSADAVRFASDHPDAPAREKFLKEIYDLYKKFQISPSPVVTDTAAKSKAKA